METIIKQLQSSDKSDHLSALEALTSLFPIPDSYLPNLISAFKSFLKRPDQQTISKTLPIMQELLNSSPKPNQVLSLIPDLIHLLKFQKYQIHDFLLHFFKSFFTKTNDQKFIPKSLFESGINKKSEELKLATLKLAIDLAKADINLAEMRPSIINLQEDVSGKVKMAASELLRLIENTSGFTGSALDSRNAFDWIPDGLLEKLENSTSWKEKCSLLEAVKETITSLEEPSLAFSSIPELISFLARVLEDPNSRLTQISIDILLHLFIFPQVRSNPAVLQMVPIILLKFADNKILIRQSVHKLIREYLKINLSFTISEIVKSLDSGNWHIKEESAILLIVSMVEYPEFQYKIFTEKLAKLLDDPRTKIRVVSTEAISVLGYLYGEEEILESLKETVDSSALKCLSDRFALKTLPTVTEEYVIFAKDVPIEIRMISSPYLMTSPIELPKMSTSFEKFNVGTPNTAESLADRSKPLSKTSRSEVFKQESIKPDNFNYILYEDLDKVTNPAEALHRATFHTEGWKEQFEVINTIRKLAKHSPEVFLSKVTLHSIVVNLAKWADSLRSSLSKNSLIAVKEICASLNKGLDGEVMILLKILLKKAADTNSFLAETAAEGLTALCQNLTEQKIVTQLLVLVESTRNPAAKAKILDCFKVLIGRVGGNLIKINDIGRVVQIINESLNDGNQEVRNSAKQAYSVLAEHLTDDLMSSPNINFSTYKKIKELTKKKNSSSLSETRSVSKADLRVTLPSLKKPKSRLAVSNSARSLISPEDEGEELKKILKIEEKIKEPDWKSRYDAISEIFDLVKGSMEYLRSSGRLKSLFSVLEKGLTDTNMKVLIHSLTYSAKIIGVVKQEIEPYLRIFIEPLVVSLGSSNSSIREVACDVCILLGISTNSDLLIPLLVENLKKTSPKGKAIVLNIVLNNLPEIKNTKFLKSEVLDLSFQFIDDIRPDVRNEACKILVYLYKTLGNVVLESAPSKKMQKVISIISSKFE